MAKILVIDDETIIRQRLKNLLELDSFETTVAENGQQGLEFFQKERPDVVLLDIKMPGMDGIEVLRKLKEISKETEVIMITGHGGVETAIEALKAGAISYIQKPVEYDELLIEIQRALEKQSLRRKLDEYVNHLEVKTRELETAYTDLRETTTQLIQSEKLSAVGKLTAGVAHELNQPLTGITFFCKDAAEQLERGEPNVESTKKILGNIQTQVGRMSKIIKHLGLFGRQSEMTLKPSDINEIVRNAVMLMGTQMKLEDIELTNELSEPCPPANVDPTMIEQVVINLLANAKDAVSGKSGGKVSLRTGVRENRKTVYIEVSDNGSGISEKNRGHLFEPFFTTKEQGKGTGLGLSICYGIVKNHNGDIQFESPAGAGTTFRVILPVA